MAIPTTIDSVHKYHISRYFDPHHHFVGQASQYSTSSLFILTCVHKLSTLEPEINHHRMTTTPYQKAKEKSRKSLMSNVNLLMQENSSNNEMDPYKRLKRIIHMIQKTYTTYHTPPTTIAFFYDKSA